MKSESEVLQEIREKPVLQGIKVFQVSLEQLEPSEFRGLRDHRAKEETKDFRDSGEWMVHRDLRAIEERLDQREKKEDLVVMAPLDRLANREKRVLLDFLGYQEDLVHWD